MSKKKKQRKGIHRKTLLKIETNTAGFCLELRNTNYWFVVRFQQVFPNRLNICFERGQLKVRKNEERKKQQVEKYATINLVFFN